MTAVDPGPEAGHTFRFLFDLRGSSSVTGDPAHTDESSYSNIPRTFTVRGWSLVEALRNAADMPFAELMGEADYEDAVRAHLGAALALMHEYGPKTRDHAGGPHHYADEWLVDLLHELIREARP